jgi:hypothetical protein
MSERYGPCRGCGARGCGLCGFTGFDGDAMRLCEVEMRQEWERLGWSQESSWLSRVGATQLEALEKDFYQDMPETKAMTAAIKAIEAITKKENTKCSSKMMSKRKAVYSLS